MSSSIVDYRAGSVRYLLPLLAAGALLGALS
ncbi:MAG: hypothetical protein K0Q72_1712, partial [Armatimonadetes bacterium]|nr:hypothetical protein [Armatimonadota bacterium]